MIKKCDGRIIHVFGVISAITVIVSGLWGGFGDRSILDYLMIATFALFAYVPFALLSFVIKQNMRFLIFLVVFGFVLFGFDMYAKYDAFIVSDSSTGGLVNVVMPIFLIGATLMIWAVVAIIGYFTKQGTEEN